MRDAAQIYFLTHPPRGLQGALALSIQAAGRSHVSLPEKVQG